MDMLTQIRTAEPITENTLRNVDRAVAALRRGEAVALAGSDGALAVALSVETLSDTALAQLVELAGGPAFVAVTARRAAVIGAADDAEGVVTLDVPGTLSADRGRRLADPQFDDVLPEGIEARIADTGSPAFASVDLARLARLLPATVVATVQPSPADTGAWATEQDLLLVGADELRTYRANGPHTLHRVTEARVPLAVAENTRIIAFRPADGGPEHLAIVIGDPAPDTPVLVRLHSECFTGDLLGSLRCDCGDQLRGALREIGRAGSGILLYLAQEGRGIGLINKLRAYRIQDRGFDTIDANEMLGFDADERLYQPAAEMLRQLGIRRIRLMTNNPGKVSDLQRHGIEVVERVPHVFPANGHNAFYLLTKAERSGHLF
jgi:GTP cyclohydrolase II